MKEEWIRRAERLILSILLIALIFIGVMLSIMQKRLTELQRGTTEQLSSQQSQIDSLGIYIEGVRDEMHETFEGQQAQLDDQQEQLTKQKNIQSTTLKAFIRYQKQEAEQAEEFREELKKD